MGLLLNGATFVWDYFVWGYFRVGYFCRATFTGATLFWHRRVSLLVIDQDIHYNRSKTAQNRKKPKESWPI